MTSKRKLDIGDAEFEFLHSYLIQMSKISVADAKSMLLMIKSFSPNSLRLKQVEYEMAKDHGDISAAAHLFSQLFSSGRELLTDEISTLFDGLKKSPPDKVSLDIFTRLSHSTQRDLFNAYFARSSCSISERTDILLYLLSLKEICSQVQLVPTIISLTYRALRDGEASLAKSSNVQPKSKLDLIPAAQTESSRSPARLLPKVADGDEGEEGEVFGDDDDEDDLTLELKPTAADSNSFKRTLPLCDYRRTLAYELLSIVYQVFDTAKLERRLLEKMVNLSLNFLYQSMASLYDQPFVFGSERRRPELVKPPSEYIVDCLRMSAVFLQWPLNLFIKQEPFDEQCPASDVTTLKPASELLAILDESWEEILLEQKQTSHSGESESNSKRRRVAQRRDETTHSNSKISVLSHQSVALFWTLLLSTAEKYVSLTRPCFAQPPIVKKDQLSVSSYPLDMSFIFPCSSMSRKPSCQNSITSTLSVLTHLWQFRKYKQVPEYYTLGSCELDLWDATIRPSTREPSPSLEEIVCFDLTLSGVLNAPWTSRSSNPDRSQDSAILDDLIAFFCPQNDHDFLRWILCAYSFNPFTRKPWNDLVRNQQDFVEKFNSVIVNSPNSESCPVQMTETCWLIPVTRRNISYLGLKVIASWLCSHMTHSSGLLEVVNLNATCLACILCQVDTLTKPDAFLTHLWPAPFQTIIRLIGSNWSEARVCFLEWIKPPISALADSSLINELVRLEANWLSKMGSTQSEFMEACVSCMKSQSGEPIFARLLRFIQTESETILSCLNDLPTLST
ncbi:hypothetical protein FGIG_06695 [Fasciola gigantica]|uniref:Uncharacterized protein n=1 Tax=Fasciola gigantica TaxID=46835 RepID=A0A504Z363_FASGI|nr:hypothetical protein FGIG_06695 [Fasciola gigantica]